MATAPPSMFGVPAPRPKTHGSSCEFAKTSRTSGPPARCTPPSFAPSCRTRRSLGSTRRRRSPSRGSQGCTSQPIWASRRFLRRARWEGDSDAESQKVVGREPRGRDVVRFVGREIVAVVVAETVWEASDAAETVGVEDDELLVRRGRRGGGGGEENVLWPAFGTNVAHGVRLDVRRGSPSRVRRSSFEAGSSTSGSHRHRWSTNWIAGVPADRRHLHRVGIHAQSVRCPRRPGRDAGARASFAFASMGPHVGGPRGQAAEIYAEYHARRRPSRLGSDGRCDETRRVRKSMGVAYTRQGAGPDGGARRPPRTARLWGFGPASLAAAQERRGGPPRACRRGGRRAPPSGPAPCRV